MHSIKTEIITDLGGKILFISNSVPGAVHDFALFQQNTNLNKSIKFFADSGYQGIQNDYIYAEIPFKKSKNYKLTKDDKEYNTALAKIRVVVEHVFAFLKSFRILRDRFRNKLFKYTLYFRVLCGIYNMRFFN